MAKQLTPNQNVRLHTLNLSQADIAEINMALDQVQSLDFHGNEVTRERFPLPNLREKLEACARNVHCEHGTSIIRGLNPREYSQQENILLFLGISSSIGDQRGLQNSKGDMLTHITEWMLWGRDDRHILHTRKALPFHSDMGCEILSLQVQSIAETGGHTYVAPLGAICDDLERTSPQVLDVLKESKWPIRKSFNESPLFQECALIGSSAGKNVVSVDSERIGPELTPEQAEALDKFQAAAGKHRSDLRAQAGDIIFINNLSLLHSRDSYEDSYMLHRHYVRLWLRHSKQAKYPTYSADNYPEMRHATGTAAFVEN
ncbi:Clavaminate synthase-like protein [Daldinia caldariorum]|uniref:Clavaminate synthase-like protein n=1 Tax=Daldinia caldariorum TaxID=326644 RepID=UPI002007AB41|nr:Clavaminate synthase-like protein [Daldinia caldariorum]KAI1463196.1 Clavaminate synthase-like protein [Daldinia caldariorum]